jgi:hypothetical protein
MLPCGARGVNESHKGDGIFPQLCALFLFDVLRIMDMRYMDGLRASSKAMSALVGIYGAHPGTSSHLQWCIQLTAVGLYSYRYP